MTPCFGQTPAVDLPAAGKEASAEFVAAADEVPARNEPNKPDAPPHAPKEDAYVRAEDIPRLPDSTDG